MSEKTSQYCSRFLLSLTVFSTLFLVILPLFLFHLSDHLTSSSVYKLIAIDNLPVYIKLNSSDEPTQPIVPESSPPIAVEAHGNLTQNNAKNDSSLEASKSCSPENALLRVYMYDLPPEYHFEWLYWKPNPNQTWPDVSDPSKIPRYPQSVNFQHSVEYWLTLDLLSSNIKGIVRPCSVIRVYNSSQADFIFVPFFASISYNRHSKDRERDEHNKNREMQIRLVEFLFRQPEWNKSRGSDHIFIAHHPNSLLYVRKKLASARFVLADFGRYTARIANLKKDVIAPYKHVVRSISSNRSAPFEQRPTLVYFQGGIHRKNGGSIRSGLYNLLKHEKDVHFKFGTFNENGVDQVSQGMRSSKFCLNLAGDTPSSNRLFDSIVSHCVPVIISDEIELPFEDVLDYSEFSIFVRATDAMKRGFLVNLLRGIEKDEWTKMWERLKEVACHFEYQYPAQPRDATDMIWQALARKKSGVNASHRERIYRRLDKAWL